MHDGLPGLSSRWQFYVSNASAFEFQFEYGRILLFWDGRKHLKSSDYDNSLCRLGWTRRSYSWTIWNIYELQFQRLASGLWVGGGRKLHHARRSDNCHCQYDGGYREQPDYRYRG